MLPLLLNFPHTSANTHLGFPNAVSTVARVPLGHASVTRFREEIEDIPLSFSTSPFLVSRRSLLAV